MTRPLTSSTKATSADCGAAYAGGGTPKAARNTTTGLNFNVEWRRILRLLRMKPPSRYAEYVPRERGLRVTYVTGDQSFALRRHAGNAMDVDARATATPRHATGRRVPLPVQ